MRRIVQYITANGGTYQQKATRELLDERVNNLISQGFQPFGSPYAADDEYLQAMVRFAPDEDPEQ